MSTLFSFYYILPLFAKPITIFVGIRILQAQICAKCCEGEQLLKCFFLVDFSDQITEQAGPELGQVQYKLGLAKPAIAR